MTPYAPPPSRRTPARVAPYRTLAHLDAAAARVLDRLARLLGPERLRHEAEAAARKAEGR